MSGTHQRSRGNFVENTVRDFLALERAVHAEIWPEPAASYRYSIPG
jgi:hypothetical protein